MVGCYVAAARSRLGRSRVCPTIVALYNYNRTSGRAGVSARRPGCWVVTSIEAAFFQVGSGDGPRRWKRLSGTCRNPLLRFQAASMALRGLCDGQGLQYMLSENDSRDWCVIGQPGGAKYMHWVKPSTTERQAQQTNQAPRRACLIAASAGWDGTAFKLVAARKHHVMCIHNSPRLIVT